MDRLRLPRYASALSHRSTGIASKSRIARFVRDKWPYLFGVVLSIVLTLPFAVRANAWYEWSYTYWLLLQQTENVHDTGLPSYFIHSKYTGLFYPNHLFYAGFTFGALAYVAQLLSPWIVFCGSIVLAMFASYVGIYWTAKYLRLPKGVAVALAGVTICAPYYVTDLYGRGAWSELVAVSMVTLLIGSVLRCLETSSRGSTSKLGLACVTISSALVVGTHNITTAIGLPFVALAVLMLSVIGVGMSVRILWKVLAASAIGGMLTAAWAFPNIWLGGDTAIANSSLAGFTIALDKASVILSPTLLWPDAQTPVSGMKVQLYNQTVSLLLVPIVFVAVALALQRWRSREDSPTLRRVAITAAGFGVTAVLLFILMTRNDVWGSDPPPIMRLVPEVIRTSIQFPYRLNSYLSLAIVLLLAVLLVEGLRRRGSRLALGLLCVATCWYVGLGLFQAVSAEPQRLPVVASFHRQDITTARPPAAALWPGAPMLSQFRLSAGPDEVATPTDILRFAPNGRLAAGQSVSARRLYDTNIVWSPLVTVRGASVIGRTDDGFAVVRTPTGASATAMQARFVRPAPVVLGFVTSGLGAALASGVLLVWFVEARRRRRSRTPVPLRPHAPSAQETGADRPG